MLDVRKLGMLAALDRLGTIAAVATELHLTAPGISMQLASLERELGLSLTERQGRRLALTAAGRVLAAHARDVVDRLSVAEYEVDALRRGAVGDYRVAAFPSAARTFVADTWRSFVDGGEGLTLTLSTPEPEEAVAELGAGAIDLAIVHSYSNVPRKLPLDLTSTPLAVEPVLLAIRSDDPAACEHIDLASLSHHRWIAPDSSRTCYEMTLRACGLAGFQPDVAAHSMDFAAQLELVAAGVGVALVPHLTVAGLPDGVTLAQPSQPLERHIHTCTRTAAATDPGLARLVALLRDAATDRMKPRTPASKGSTRGSGTGKRTKTLNASGGGTAGHR